MVEFLHPWPFENVLRNFCAKRSPWSFILDLIALKSHQLAFAVAKINIQPSTAIDFVFCRQINSVYNTADVNASTKFVISSNPIIMTISDDLCHFWRYWPISVAFAHTIFIWFILKMSFSVYICIKLAWSSQFENLSSSSSMFAYTESPNTHTHTQIQYTANFWIIHFICNKSDHFSIVISSTTVSPIMFITEVT